MGTGGLTLVVYPNDVLTFYLLKTRLSDSEQIDKVDDLDGSGYVPISIMENDPPNSLYYEWVDGPCAIREW